MTAATFAAHLDTGEGPFLRTGDLGLVRGTELFVTGRLKDVLVIHGANHYPSDIERTAAACHPDLQPDAGAAFGVSVDGEEKLVVVNEVHRSAMRRLDGATIGRAIRRAVFEEHDIPVHAVVLVAPTSVPKTSSGKIQRQACKAAFLQHTLRECWSDIASAPVADERSASRADEIVAWLRWYGEHRINSRLMDERRSIPPHIVLDFARHGLLGLQAPVEHGGIALSFHDTFRVLEQLAAIDLSLCSFVGVHNVLAVRPVAQFGSDEQRRTVLRELAEGRQLGSFAFTEPAAGSNPLAITATATPTATGWTLQGSKKWIGTAAWAGYVHVFAHLRNAAGGHDGITAFIVPQDTAGFRQGPEELTLGMRAMVQNSIYMDDVHVGPEHVLGTVGQGLPIAYDIMQFARVQVAAGALGGMKRCFQLMSRYASRRTIATGRLLDNVISRDRLSDLAIEISAVEAFVYAFASWLDRGLHVPEELFAAVKVAAPEALGRAADHLVQMLGGRGYIETNIAPQIVRDARLLRIFEGPSETMLMFIGARLFSGSGLVLEFLSDRLGQPDLASQLADAVQAVRDHFSRAASNDARQQAAFVLGELGIAAVWRAAIEDHAQRTTDPNHARALAWATTRFERSRQRAAEARPDDRALLGGDEILAIARRHIEGIGDVVQRAAGELHQLDALLQRDEDAAGSHASRATRDVTVHVSSRPPELTATSVSVAGATADLERWIQRWIAERLHVDAAAISPRKPFYDFGVDSVTALELTSGLGEKLTRDLPATLLWDYPNIHELAVYLASASAREVARDPVRTLPVEEDESGLTELEIEQRLELELRFLGRSQFH